MNLKKRKNENSTPLNSKLFTTEHKNALYGSMSDGIRYCIIIILFSVLGDFFILKIVLKTFDGYYSSGLKPTNLSPERRFCPQYYFITCFGVI